MSVIPVVGAARSGGVRQKLAQTLDKYLADRSRRAVPESALRRCKREADRCRRLLIDSSIEPAELSVDRLRRAAWRSR